MTLARLESVNTAGPEWTLLLRSIVDRIVAVEPECQILVFGSFARKEFTAASDLDLAVILDGPLSPKEFRSRLSASGPISRWPVDLIVFPRSYFEERKDFGGVCVDIHQQGVELYPSWGLYESKDRPV